MNIQGVIWSPQDPRFITQIQPKSKLERDIQQNNSITPRKTNKCPLKINGWKMYFLLK